MTFVTYTRFGYTRRYTPIPMDKLDEVRTQTRKSLKDLEAQTGKRYGIRTFFLGPRPFQPGTKAASTLKSNARAAKIAIYEVCYNSNHQFSYTDLVTYV